MPTNTSNSDAPPQPLSSASSTTRAPLPWEDGAPTPDYSPRDQKQASSPNDDPIGFPLTELSLHGPRSMAGISLRAFLLGSLFSLSISLTLTFIFLDPSPLWRPAFFAAALSLFHFLEFYVTAAYNAPCASVSAFLLSSNGKEYQLAHLASFAECIVTALWFPAWQERVSWGLLRAVGGVLVLLGQGVRSAAMATAGTNFNHFVQRKRAADHELVTRGVYSRLRHPSYFGFFWWAIGTQMVLGNVVTGTLFAAVLWEFFRRRIPNEESFLVVFFGDDYREYCKRSWIGIPFIKGSNLLTNKDTKRP